MDNEFRARHIALKTLTQRCEYLQQKLDAVEEENYQLKLQKVQGSFDEISKTSTDTSYVQEQIVLLNKQKSQLSHRIQMITSENQALWSQLTKFLPGNESLGTKLSVSVKNQDSNFTQPANCLRLNDSGSVLSDFNGKESLEEISLKLINSILMGKTELENQYSEMIDLQRENDAVEMKNSSILSLQYDSRTTTNNFKMYVQKLKEFKQALYLQKNELKNAITNMKNFQKVYVCSKCSSDLFNGDKVSENVIKTNNDESGSDLSTSHDTERINEEGTSSSDMVCPMCSQTFTGQFTKFYQHVSDHFDDENEPSYLGDGVSFDIIP